MNNPLNGIKYLFQGFRLLNQPGVRQYVIIPLVINVLIFAGLGYLAFGWLDGLVTQMMNDLPEWLQWISWLIWLIIYGASIVLLYFTFTVMANFVSAPFNGVLSEAIEEHITGEKKQDDTPWHQAIMQAGPAIKEEIVKFTYSITRSLPFFVLFFIPGVNFIASPLWMMFGAWMLAIQYADYPFSNAGVEFKRLRTQLGSKRLMVFGFGCTVMLGTMIPIINLFIIPAAVAGATVMYLKEFKEETKVITES